MTKKIQILCTLGPSSLNKKFLNFTNNKVSLLRLNMSHVKSKKLKHHINFIKKNTSTPICIDTEGAQIRTKINKKKKFKINQIFKIHKLNGKIMLYPPDVFNKLKINDTLDIGFNDLVAKTISKNKKYLSLKTISSGTLEGNKGVHIKNRLLKLNYLTKKDFEAIKIAKKYKLSPRHVGKICSQNKLLLLVPCHRVIRTNGSIGGFTSVGGIKLKKKILEFEKK